MSGHLKPSYPFKKGPSEEELPGQAAPERVLDESGFPRVLPWYGMSPHLLLGVLATMCEADEYSGLLSSPENRAIARQLISQLLELAFRDRSNNLSSFTIKLDRDAEWLPGAGILGMNAVTLQVDEQGRINLVPLKTKVSQPEFSEFAKELEGLLEFDLIAVDLAFLQSKHLPLWFHKQLVVLFGEVLDKFLVKRGLRLLGKSDSGADDPEDLKATTPAHVQGLPQYQLHRRLVKYVSDQQWQNLIEARFIFVKKLLLELP